MLSWLAARFSFASVQPNKTRRLVVEQLEDRVVPAGVIAVGSGPGVPPVVALFHDTNNDGVPDGAPYAQFSVLDPGFLGGVRVAVGNFIGNANLEVAVAAGPGGGPRVQIFQLDATDMPTGTPESFFAMDNNFNGGLFLSRFNSAGSGLDSLIVSADAGGGPRVEVFNDAAAINGATPGDGILANSLVDSFFAFEQAFHGGVRIAAGRNLAAAGGDFLALAAGPGGGPRVEILKDANTNFLLSDDLPTADSFFAFEQAFHGGLFVAMGDIGSSSTNPEVIVSADAGGGPRVAIFSDSNLNGKYADENGPVSSFYAYDQNYTGGVRVAYSRLSSANVGQSGEVVTAPGTSPISLPVETFKTKINTGEIQPGDLPLGVIYPFGLNYTDGYFVAYDGNGISP
jgi:hypothetical protein